MELMGELVNNQLTLYIPVALVLVGAILVFTFGFKSAEQPPFDKLSSSTSEDRRSTGKKRKPKEKKTANGFAVPVAESKNEKSTAKDKDSKRSPTKETPDTPKQSKKQETNSPKQADKKKVESQKPTKIETVEQVKNKKNLKTKSDEKPMDFDDGSWETVPSKNDKKKKQDSPAKKDKKAKKPEKSDNKEKSAEIEKLVKEEVEKQLQEDNKENKTSENIKKKCTSKSCE